MKKPDRPGSAKQKLKRSTSKPRAGTKRTAVIPPATVIGHYNAVVDETNRVLGDMAREPNRDRAHRWSITYRTRESLFKDEPSERRPGTFEEFHPAALEQFEEARQTAMKILDSGVVGAGECLTIISGQGNTDHQPTNGQPNDGLSIVIRQVGS